jgi:hypothetical protein
VKHLRRTNPPWKARLSDVDPLGRSTSWRDVYQVDVSPLARREVLSSLKIVGSKYTTRKTLRVTAYALGPNGKELAALDLDEIDGGRGTGEVTVVDRFLRSIDSAAALDRLEAQLVEALQAREALGRFETLAKMGGA